MNNKRYYNFLGIIYPDDPDYLIQYNNLFLENEIICILHDRDVDEEGRLKKPHLHFIIKLKNACTLNALSKRLNINCNNIEPIKNSLNSSLKYLIHYNDDNKYQYSINDIKYNNEKLYNRLCDLVSENMTEVEKVIIIQDFIENYHGILNFSILGRYAQKNNLWDAFRRNMTYFCKIVEEHNQVFYNA